MHVFASFAAVSCLALSALAQTPPAPAPAPAPAQEQKPEAPKVLQLGQRIDGELTLTDIDGKPQRAHDLMGKITVVNFFSIQCPIQKAWDGRLAEIQKEFEAQDVVFLHIDSNVTEIGAEPPKAGSDDKPYDNIRQHLAGKQLPFRVLVDHGNRVADMFGAKTTPHIYVFGKDGRLVYKGLVDSDARNKDPEGRTNHLRDVLGTLVKGDKVEPYSTKEEGCTIKRVKAAAKTQDAKADKK